MVKRARAATSTTGCVAPGKRDPAPSPGASFAPGHVEVEQRPPLRLRRRHDRRARLRADSSPQCRIVLQVADEGPRLRLAPDKETVHAVLDELRIADALAEDDHRQRHPAAR